MALAATPEQRLTATTRILIGRGMEPTAARLEAHRLEKIPLPLPEPEPLADRVEQLTTDLDEAIYKFSCATRHATAATERARILGVKLRAAEQEAGMYRALYLRALTPGCVAA